jgi:hypothetical protein
MADPKSLEYRIAGMEADIVAPRAEAEVSGGAFVWLMGAHQLASDHRAPRRGDLKPLGLALDFGGANPDKDADPSLASASREFVEAAYSVLLSRQAAS